MKNEKDKTSSHYIKVLLDHSVHLGLDLDNVRLQAKVPSGLTFKKNEWVSNKVLTELVKAVWRLSEDEGMGYFSSRMKPGQAALVFNYMADAKNLGGFYRRGQHILSYLPPEEFGFKIQFTDNCVTIMLHDHMSDKDPTHFMTEFVMLVWHRFACWAIDEHIPLQRAAFSFAKPEHAWFYNQLFHCELQFNQPYTGFTFAISYLRKLISRSERELEVWLRNSPADLMYLSPTDPSISTKVKLALRNGLEHDSRILDFETICRTLHITPQVVRRRLISEGSSYQKLKDAVRRHMAFELLRNKQIPISEIAIKTGFSEPAAFSRAFKKWTTKSPAEYRENLSP